MCDLIFCSVFERHPRLILAIVEFELAWAGPTCSPPWTTRTASATARRFTVMGGGISGLAAAYFYRAAVGPDVRILILDNHDDFGGHAKRNEFELDGKIQLINGGTLGIDSQRRYSAVAAGLLTAIGSDPATLQARYTDPAPVCVRPGIWLIARSQPSHGRRARARRSVVVPVRCRGFGV
jgi:hypothetical protein